MAREVGMGRAKDTYQHESWEAYLDAGETLLWQGAPATGVRFTGKGMFISIFGLVFLGFSLVWVSMAFMINSGTALDYAFPLFGLPFVLVGLWMVFGHWFYDAYKRKHARYALTSKRAIIARSVINRHMESYSINATSPLSLVKGDLDTVNFAERVYHGKNGPRRVSIGFRYIQDGQTVYNLMQNVKKENAGTPAEGRQWNPLK